MIRFIDLGKQIAVDETDPSYPRQFAFFDTIYSQFVRINGDVVFDSMNDLLRAIELDEDFGAEKAIRFFSLCPEWVTVGRVCYCGGCDRPYETTHIGPDSAVCPRCNPKDTKGNTPLPFCIRCGCKKDAEGCGCDPPDA